MSAVSVFAITSLLAATALMAVFLAATYPALSSAGAVMDGARPGDLVRLDGRRINVRCLGAGAPTVILESGYEADSLAWWKVEPEVARFTRVCSYDRAGAGFSDPGPLPRDGAAIAADLDKALSAAGIRGPFVLVGHSAGGFTCGSSLAVVRRRWLAWCWWIRRSNTRTVEWRTSSAHKPAASRR